jgi:hypothetical protein
VKPQVVDQVSLGYFRNFLDNKYECSFETYYKNLGNQIDYRNGADLIFNAEYEGALTYGKGIAYGAEFYVKKSKGKITVSANWVFNTGDAATFPSGKYTIDQIQVPYYTERNGYRYPNYHRLDVGVTFLGKPRKRYEGSWNVSVYNAYARENAYTITFQQNEDNPEKTEALRTALFKIIPSVTYNFKFK